VTIIQIIGNQQVQICALEERLSQALMENARLTARLEQAIEVKRLRPILDEMRKADVGWVTRIEELVPSSKKEEA
jgi:hypothetical protein